MILEQVLEEAAYARPGYSLVSFKEPTITFAAERELSGIQKKFDNFKLVFLGNTHRKLLVSDDKFAVVTSFNWLSFSGDPSKKPRDEFGFLVTEPDGVEGIFQDGLELLSKGYHGPASGKPLGSKKV